MAGEATVLHLRCPSCGAGLGIAHDLESFACSYCGAEALVERRGGTVSLKRVMDVVKRVQVAADKTAAELALQRLTAELARMRVASAVCEDEATRGLAEAKGGLSKIVVPLGLALGFVGIMGPVGFELLTDSSLAGGLLILLAAGLLTGALFALRHDIRARAARVRAVERRRNELRLQLTRGIAETERKIGEQRRIVGS